MKTVNVKSNISFKSNLISRVKGNILVLHGLEIVLYTQAIKTLAQHRELFYIHKQSTYPVA